MRERQRKRGKERDQVRKEISYLGSLEEDGITDMLDPKCDDTQSHAREDVSIVTLSWYQCLPVWHCERIKGASTGEDTLTLCK